MNIGQLARQAGVPIDTVRYYERQQLLPTAARSVGATASSVSRTCAGCASSAAPRRWASAWNKSPNCWHSVIATRRTWAACATRHRPDCRTSRSAWLNCNACTARSQLVDACPGHGTLDQCPILAALTDGAD